MTLMKIEGGRKIAAVAIALRHLGEDRTIINEMAKRIRRSLPRLRQAVRDSARSTLPRRGGLGAWVGRSSIRASVTRGARNAGVRLVAGRNSDRGRSDLRRIDAGGTRHPLWGNRAHWYPQVVQPGFASRVMEGPALEEFRDETLASIDAAVAQVLRGL